MIKLLILAMAPAMLIAAGEESVPQADTTPVETTSEVAPAESQETKESASEATSESAGDLRLIRLGRMGQGMVLPSDFDHIGERSHLPRRCG